MNKLSKAILNELSNGGNDHKNPINPSKTRNFPLTIEGVTFYINPYRLTSGNSKLVNIFIFDLPAGRIDENGSCINCESCENTCYALQAQIQYKLCRFNRLVNLYLAKYDKMLLKTLLKAQLSIINLNNGTVRIHSSGDFFSQDYINFWGELIEQFPSINFYAYTKTSFSFPQKDNFNIINSIINNKINYGSESYVKKLVEKYNAFLCPVSTNKNIKCGKDCSYCVKNNKVCFIIHGTRKTK